MVDRVDVAEVHLWDRQIGAVAWDEDRQIAAFEYLPSFIRSGVEVAPLTMPRESRIYQFPELSATTFRGLPGLLADSLPDRFGNSLIDAWLARQGRDRSSFSPVERLCYVGSRGMGALEYHPPTRRSTTAKKIDIDELADLAARMLAQRAELDVELDDDGLAELLRVGTSAGGARAKAVVAWNPETNELRSGQVAAPEGFESWILKFDGVGSSGYDLGDPEGFGRVEYAYHLMATAAGIDMMPSRVFVDAGGRAHFMTKRFDRTSSGGKLHIQTLNALAHLDFNLPGAHSYEQALAATLEVCGANDVDRLFRRMAFNVVARNQDDHTKNITFVMDPSGRWQLSPAYDVMWAFNPSGEWTSRHQMTVAGKTDHFDREDLATVAEQFGIRAADAVVDEIVAAVVDWETFAKQSGVSLDHSRQIAMTHRLL